MSLTDSDRNILRDLAMRVAEIADDPVMATRRHAWVEHNALRSTSPMILVFPEGSWRELLPDASLKCEESRARTIESNLRMRIYGFEHFQDDPVVEKNWYVSKCITSSG